MEKKKYVAALSVTALAALFATTYTPSVKAAEGDVYDLAAKTVKYSRAQYMADTNVYKQAVQDTTNNQAGYGIEKSSSVYSIKKLNDNIGDKISKGATVLDAIKAMTDGVTAEPITPVNQALTVSSVSAINDITVDNGTTADKLGLPTTVGVTLSDGTTKTANVAWDTTSYVATTAGTYALTGTVTPATGDTYTVPAGTTAKVNVIVSAPAALVVQSVSAINSTTLGVTVNGTLTDAQKSAATFTVIKDGSTPITVTATWNGNTANLVKADGSKFVAGSYSVKVAIQGVTFANDTATSTVAAEKATSIKISTDRISSAISQVLSYEIDNQYGEKMNLASNLLTVMVYNTTAPSRSVSNTDVTLDAHSANVGDALKVTAYLTSDPTVQLVKTVTVSNITVGNVTIGDLVPNANTDRVSIGDTGVVLPITLTDDAGNAFLPSYNGAIASGSTHDGLTYTYSGITALSYSTTTKKYTVTATATPATITISNPASGQVVTKALTLNPVGTAKTVAFGNLTGDIVSGDTTNLPKLPVNFTDQYGKAVVLANASALPATFSAQITGAGATPLAINATITNTNGQDYLTFSNIPTATPGTYTLTLTNTSTGTQVSTNLTVNAARVPATLSVKTAPSASIIGTGTTSITFDVVDEYGQKVSSNAAYDIKETTASGGSTIVSVPGTSAIASPTTITITGVAAGSDTVTFTLEKVSDGTVIDTKSVAVTDIATVASYAATTDKTSYTAGDTMTITVNALNGSGQPYTAYNGSGVATVTLTPNAGTPINYLRNLQFVNGVATTTVPVTVADATGTAVQVAYDSQTAIVGTTPTVAAAAMSKFAISATGTTATITAVDASGNTIPGYTGTKIVKATYVDSTGAAKAITGADADGNVQVTFTSGVGTVTLGTAVASGDKITVSVDGFTGSVTK